MYSDRNALGPMLDQGIGENEPGATAGPLRGQDARNRTG
jgi:hypothetical protein